MGITGFGEGKVGSLGRLRKGRKFFQGSAIGCGCFISTRGESIAFFSHPSLMGSMVGAFYWAFLWSCRRATFNYLKLLKNIFVTCTWLNNFNILYLIGDTTLEFLKKAVP